jgi:steroid 5-alpha reductase family enzyme
MIIQTNNSSDFAGGTNFVVLAIITLAFSRHHNARQIVASLFIMVWGARLSAFLLFRILKTGKDDRFDDKRDKFFPFLGFWVFQMLWVWIVSLPVTLINSPKVTRFPQPDFGTASDIAGVILYAIGIVMETVSDAQKYRFKVHQSDKSAICDKGFFSWTRHPNYFGEILIQFGKLFLNCFLEQMLIKCSYLYDCCITRSRRLCPWRSS